MDKRVQNSKRTFMTKRVILYTSETTSRRRLNVGKERKKERGRRKNLEKGNDGILKN